MKLLALGKPIKKPPRSDERDGELFCGTTDGLILLTSGGTGVVHAAQDNLTYSTGYYLGIACVVTNRSTIRGTNTTSCNVTLIKDDFTQNNAVSKSGNWSIDVTDYAYVTINAGNTSNSGKISLS